MKEKTSWGFLLPIKPSKGGKQVVIIPLEPLWCPLGSVFVNNGCHVWRLILPINGRNDVDDVDVRPHGPSWALPEPPFSPVCLLFKRKKMAANPLYASFLPQLKPELPFSSSSSFFSPFLSLIVSSLPYTFLCIPFIYKNSMLQSASPSPTSPSSPTAPRPPPRQPLSTPERNQAPSISSRQEQCSGTWA